MKFVKRLSIFFIYPLTMFAMGFASNMAIMEFFYPGEQEEAVKENYLEGQNNECQASPDIPMFSQMEKRRFYPALSIYVSVF